MDAAKVAELKLFISLCQKQPAMLRDPQLKFFRDYLESLGATLPPEASDKEPKQAKVNLDDIDGDEEDFVHEATAPAEESHEQQQQKQEEEAEEEEEEIVESDVELDNEGVLTEADEEQDAQKMGNPSLEVTEEMREAAQAAKAKAVEAMAEDKFEEAVSHFTDAILSNPTSSILYGNRAATFVKLKKPHAAIRDCDAALKLNPDSARALKARGQALALLGRWEQAAADLRQAAQIDFDEETNSLLHKVEPNVQRLREHRRKYERLRKEREERVQEKERRRRKKAAEAAYEAEKQRERSSARAKSSGGFGGMPGGMPFGMGGGMPAGMGGGMPAGMGGGMPAGMGGGMPNMADILQDPELMAGMQDPAVMAALQDVMSNPANFLKYQSDPKVGPILMKLMSKFGGR